MGIRAHFVFLFSSLTLGSCRSKSSTGGTKRILIGCILTWLSSQTSEEASTSPTASRSKQASSGRGRLLGHKKGKNGDLNRVKAAHAPRGDFPSSLRYQVLKNQWADSSNTQHNEIWLKSHIYRTKYAFEKRSMLPKWLKKKTPLSTWQGIKAGLYSIPTLSPPWLHACICTLLGKHADAVLVPPTLASIFSRAWDNFYWPHQIPPLLLEAGRAPWTNPLYVTFPYFCKCNKYLPAQRQCLQYLLLAQTQNPCCWNRNLPRKERKIHHKNCF